MENQKKIGRYLVESMLGEGAMGSVYKARDPFIQRLVAIKTIKLDQSRNQQDANEFHDRFIQEAQISGTLNHPNIVGIFDIGHQDGEPYIAMEYVEGETLADLIHGKSRPDTSHLFQILLQIAHALDFAHEKGIVHRDLKPTNIMVMENGMAKIMDFGIAKRSGSNLTQTGVFLGTPSYSSPEQIKEGHVDNRSDIFSFGILAHETLTSHLPFPGQSINAILYKIANEAPSFAPNLKELKVDIPAWREVFNKVLNKNPDMRYQKAAAFANALFPCLKFSSEERAQVGQFLNQFGTTLHESFGVQKNLRRSEFEIAQGRGEPVSETIKLEPAKKRGGFLQVAMLIMLLAGVAAGIVLWQTGQWRPLWEQWQALIGGETVVVANPVPADIEKILTIGSEPSGARVILGQTELGETPLSHAWKGIPGESLEFRFDLEDYEPATRTLTLAADLEEKMLVTLEQKAIARVIQSTPAGAAVSIDGESVGQTPLNFNFQPGATYRIQVRKGGYIAKSLNYAEGKTGESRLSFDLEPVPPPGALTVQTLMEDLQVYANGQRHKGLDIDLEEGSYTIRLQSSRYFYQETKKVAIRSGQSVSLGTPVIITIPKIDFIGGYVKVKIDGRYVERNGEPDTTPIVDLKIAAGTHQFEFIDQGDKIIAQQTKEVTSSDSITATADP